MANGFKGRTVLLTGATGEGALIARVDLAVGLVGHVWRTPMCERALWCAAGFVGSIVLEQLFRECPGVKKVGALSVTAAPCHRQSLVFGCGARSGK